MDVSQGLVQTAMHNRVKTLLSDSNQLLVFPRMFEKLSCFPPIFHLTDSEQDAKIRFLKKSKICSVEKVTNRRMWVFDMINCEIYLKIELQFLAQFVAITSHLWQTFIPQDEKLSSLAIVKETQ